MEHVLEPADEIRKVLDKASQNVPVGVTFSIVPLTECQICTRPLYTVAQVANHVEEHAMALGLALGE